MDRAPVPIDLPMIGTIYVDGCAICGGPVDPSNEDLWVRVVATNDPETGVESRSRIVHHTRDCLA